MKADDMFRGYRSFGMRQKLYVWEGKRQSWQGRLGQIAQGLWAKVKNLKHFSFNATWHLVLTLSLHNCFFLSFFFFFWWSHVACGILVPLPEIEPSPQKWKCRLLTTGPPGNSHNCFFWKHLVTFRNPELFTHSIVYSFINMYWAPTCISSCMEIGGLRNWLLGHSLKSCEHFLKILQST